MSELGSSVCFILIPMLWVYAHYKLFYSFSVGTVFRRQNLTYKDGSRAVKVKILNSVFIMFMMINLLYILFYHMLSFLILVKFQFLKSINCDHVNLRRDGEYSISSTVLLI